jgi:hypothetical protein
MPATKNRQFPYRPSHYSVMKLCAPMLRIAKKSTLSEPKAANAAPKRFFLALENVTQNANFSKI